MTKRRKDTKTERRQANKQASKKERQTDRIIEIMKDRIKQEQQKKERQTD